MTILHDLQDYKHPYVTVDGVLLRFKKNKLEVKLIQQPKLDGKWSLPGGFVHIDRLAIDTLREVMLDKAGEKGFYAEQLQTYDALDRDERGRIISIAYLCLTNDLSGDDGWFIIRDNGELIHHDLVLRKEELAFDHGQFVMDAKERLTNKLWYSDIPKYLFPELFRPSEVQSLYELLEGSRYYRNFKRNMGERLEETDQVSENGPGPKAVLYRWAKLKKGV